MLVFALYMLLQSYAYHTFAHILHCRALCTYVHSYVHCWRTVSLSPRSHRQQGQNRSEADNND